MAENSLQSFSSVQAARILGVNVSSIKRWTDSGLLECTRTAGGHRKFLARHLLKFVEESAGKMSIQPLIPIDNAQDLSLAEHIFHKDYDYIKSQLLVYAQEGNIAAVQTALGGLLSSATPLHDIYDTIVTPVMHAIGDLWAEGKLSVVEEHVTSRTIQQALHRLQALIPLPTRASSAALCLTFSSEEHDIALQMVGHILEKRGFRVLFAGSKTPPSGLEAYFRRQLIERLYLSCTLVIDPISAARELEQICEYGNSYGVRIFVGGQGVQQLNGRLPKNVVQLTTFQEVFKS